MASDFELSMDELRAVARYVVQTAEELLPVFEAAHPGDPRPRMAVGAAWDFVRGAPRTKRQRVTAMDAHRAAREASSEAARLAAQAAGDAASAAYLHPVATPHQVGHILRAAANAARIAEISDGCVPEAALEAIRHAQTRATPVLVDVLRRYPPVPAGKSRVARLLSLVDTALRRQDVSRATNSFLSTLPTAVVGSDDTGVSTSGRA